MIRLNVRTFVPGGQRCSCFWRARRLIQGLVGMNAMAIWCYAALFSPSLLVYVAMAYQVPTSSGLQMHSNGTMTVDLVFQNWTGFWAFSASVPAGESCFALDTNDTTRHSIWPLRCSIELRILCITGLYLTDENDGIWSGDDELIVTVSPKDETSVDRRGK